MARGSRIPDAERIGHDWEPGDIIVRPGRDARVVLAVGKYVVGLRKVGRSWTDPNPVAWYCRYRNVLHGFVRTGKKSEITEREIAYLENRSRAMREPEPWPLSAL